MVSEGFAQFSNGVSEQQTNKLSRLAKPKYHKIHALPLPLNVYPLPPLIPHNPLSVIYIAASYLAQLLVPPSSHPPHLHQAYYSHQTSSVHVVEADAVKLFWERGFFGKGNLSRSEPSWVNRERRKKGFGADETSEEVTRRRRNERKEFKTERARKEREAIEEKLEDENRRRATQEAVRIDDARLNSQSSEPLVNQRQSQSLDLQSGENSNNFHHKKLPMFTDAKYSAGDAAPQNQTYIIKDNLNHDNPNNSANNIENQEHLQLMSEEAFFLTYSLGILEIRDETTSNLIDTVSLFSLFRQNSYFPPRHSCELQPDDPFILSYAVYHHFRSLGWVVRAGIKFGVDFLLYNRGPVFSHAEFAVLILPAYSRWPSTSATDTVQTRKASKSWWWLHCANRVQSQVRKSLILVYVEIPPPPPPQNPPKALSSSSATDPLLKRATTTMSESGPVLNITSFLKQYKIREITVQRWTPNRSRD